MELHYTGNCSLAAHIVAREAGVPCAELLGEVEELVLRTEVIKRQVSAINQVIAIQAHVQNLPSD